MRKSTSTRSRLTRAGIATGVIAAAVLATATPAFAADTAVVLSPTTGPTGGGNTVTFTGTGVFTGSTTYSGRLIPGAGSCAAAPGTANTTTNVTVAVSKVGNDNDGSFIAPSLPVGAYRLCLYNVATTSTTGALIGHSTNTYTVSLASPTLSSTAGAAGTATTVTATGSPAGNTFIGAATAVGATFSTAACPTTYTTTAGNIVATASKTSTSVASITTPTSLVAPNVYNVCIYNGTAGTSALIGSTTYSALPTVSLSPAVGPDAGGNTITVSSTTAFLTGVATPKVVFSRDNCTPYYPQTGTPIASVTVNRITDNKVAILVPIGVVLNGGETTAPYNVCIYTGTSSSDALVAVPATYTIAPALGVTSIAPTAGPAQGGSLVTITGSGFPTAADAVVSASVGGSPLTRVRVVNGTTITGYTTAHAPGSANVSVTTAAGTKNAVGTPYTYTYGITVAPNTAPAGTTPYIDILGAGFSSLTFGTSPQDNDTHVFMVDDRYSSAEASPGSGTWNAPPVTECTNVVPISDTEIICQLDLANTLVAAGTTSTSDPAEGSYTIEVVTDAEPGATLAANATSIISSGSTFTVAPY
ncbi:IPT/TIG domain-containing protein [Couchioplanes caeruleus]|uniref:IPT/TIG domain-containing protein n=1 Tax=Couchioplanes caeruleus TaxID=56438 RepID=UPI0020BEA4AA|nr:IPT/TIG domain-containing protein [Couchioplanes caeruleus]UQU66937.1 IPT/TIG domain-containing protein [Couchioplanes caeruleus]